MVEKMTPFKKSKKIAQWFFGLLGFSFIGSLIHFSEELPLTELIAGLLYFAFLAVLVILPEKKTAATPRLLKVLPWIWILNFISAIVLGIILWGDHLGKWNSPPHLLEVHPLEIIWAIVSSVTLLAVFKRPSLFLKFFYGYCLLDVALGIGLLFFQKQSEEATAIEFAKLGIQLATLIFLVVVLTKMLPSGATKMKTE